MSVENVRMKARKLLNHLSEEKARVAVSFLEFLDEKECWEATREILGDRKLTESIRRGRMDIAKGKVRRWREVKKNV